MAFRNNSELITTAAEVDVVANGPVIDNYSGAGGSTAFVIADGQVGDDVLEDFGSDDSIITFDQIFDGNGDGFIAFGPNGVLDVDRFGRRDSQAGQDQLQVVGLGGVITEIRYLGTKGGQYAYADAATLRNLASEFGDTDLANDTGVVEGTVADDTIDASGTGTIILVDNNLGLNLGGDTINSFGDDDAIVTTALLFDSDSDGDVEFFNNQVLDVSTEAPQSSDPSTGPGGQIDINSPDMQAVYYLGTRNISGVDYYFYGTEDSTFDIGA